MNNKFNGISFIIPAYNEERYISKSLQSILDTAKNIDLPYEIIVINNGSTDRTPEIALPYSHQVVDIEKSKVSVARNTGVSCAKFNLFAFIDADTVLEDKWLSEIKIFTQQYKSDEMIITGAPVVIPKDPSWIEKSWFNSTSKNYIGGANIICTRAAFNRVGGFDETLETGEDYAFCKTASNCGVELVINYNFEAVHLGFPKTISDFAKREIWHGKGDCKNLKVFATSKVSVMSLIYAFLTFSIVISMGSIFYLVFFAALLFFINLGLTFKRFGFCEFNIFSFNYFLNYVYFFSRFFSLIIVLREKVLSSISSS